MPIQQDKKRKYAKVNGKYYELAIEVDKPAKLIELKKKIANLDEKEKKEIAKVKVGFVRLRNQLEDEVKELEEIRPTTP